jgi:hypothetical protein
MLKFLFAYALIISHGALFSQDINMASENVTKMLCRKWKVDYIMTNGMKISPGPSAPEIKYEFKSDNTYLLLDKDPAKNGKGKWNFDANKKLINLMGLNGASNSTIISLREDELVMLLSMKEATPDDPSDMKIFFKRID